MGYTEAQMLGLLRQRYTCPRPGWEAADRYVRAKHVRYPTPGYSGGALRIADYLVIDTHTPQRIIGIEVKVSRADMAAEARNPGKSETWRQHCHQWYAATPDADTAAGLLPAGWGHLTIDPAVGTLRVARAARRNPNPLPLPLPVLAQLGRAITQTVQYERLEDDPW